jgi:oligosaccharyltransferase complex subunit alpha (ribophorin I)
MRPFEWRPWLSLLLLQVFPSFAAGPLFENTAIVRTTELGGSLVHVSTTYAIKALEQDAKIYTIALSEDEVKRSSWLEIKLKSTGAVLPVTNHGLDPDQYVSTYLVATLRLNPPLQGMLPS